MSGEDAVSIVRRFNRTYTQRIGVLEESFLQSGRPLGPSRVLFEIGRGGAGVAELRDRLALDSGYLSRLLRALEAEGLVTVAVEAEDGRRRRATLTSAGGQAWDELNQRSDQVALALLDPLSPRQQEALAAALTRADRLVRVATLTFDLIDPRSPAALEALGRYFDELDQRFVGGFEPGDTLVADAPALRPPTGAFLVALDDGRPVACGGLVRIDGATAEIKRMWVHPDWRGEGLGRRMLSRLEDRAVALGHQRVMLDTNAVLDEAIALYQRSGYTPVARYNDNPYAAHWFARTLTTG